jgi:hypothetical protein
MIHNVDEEEHVVKGDNEDELEVAGSGADQVLAQGGDSKCMPQPECLRPKQQVIAAKITSMKLEIPKGHFECLVNQGGLMDVDAKGIPWTRTKGACMIKNIHGRWTKDGKDDVWGAIEAPALTTEHLKRWETMQILRRRRRMQWQSQPCRRRQWCGRCGHDVDNCDPVIQLVHRRRQWWHGGRCGPVFRG